MWTEFIFYCYSFLFKWFIYFLIEREENKIFFPPLKFINLKHTYQKNNIKLKKRHESKFDGIFNLFFRIPSVRKDKKSKGSISRIKKIDARKFLSCSSQIYQSIDFNSRCHVLFKVVGCIFSSKYIYIYKG